MVNLAANEPFFDVDPMSTIEARLVVAINNYLSCNRTLADLSRDIHLSLKKQCRSGATLVSFGIMSESELDEYFMRRCPSETCLAEYLQNGNMDFRYTSSVAKFFDMEW